MDLRRRLRRRLRLGLRRGLGLGLLGRLLGRRRRRLGCVGLIERRLPGRLLLYKLRLDGAVVAVDDELREHGHEVLDGHAVWVRVRVRVRVSVRVRVRVRVLILTLTSAVDEDQEVEEADLVSYELTIERICRCSCCRTRETFSSRSTAAVASARPAGSAAWCLKPLTKAESTWLGLG